MLPAVAATGLGWPGPAVNPPVLLPTFPSASSAFLPCASDSCSPEPGPQRIAFAKLVLQSLGTF